LGRDNFGCVTGPEVVGSRPTGNYWERIVSFLFAKNNRSKSVWTLLFQRKLLIIKPCGRLFSAELVQSVHAPLKSFHLFELGPRGHHDWPVKPTNHPEPLDRQQLFAQL
jgi:hypothetical protein